MRKSEVDEPLDDPLAELVRGLGRVEVEELRAESTRRNATRNSRSTATVRVTRPSGPREPVERPDGEERDRREVGEVDRARCSVHLLERGAEHRREEEGTDEAALESRRAHLTPVARGRRNATRANARADGA